MSDNKVVYSKWIKRGVNTFIPTDNSETLKAIDPGYYELRFSDGIGFYMFRRELYLDDMIEFPSNIHQEVLQSIKLFWKKSAAFKKYGFAFKRGILLHGKPGSGKTCIINLCMKYMISELNGVVISLQSGSDLELYSKFVPEIFRTIEPNRPIIIIFEDIENLLKYNGTESVLLNVLDGLDQLENVVYLATTNYIENLRERIINRPSRFDRRIYVPFLSYADRLFYFTQKLNAKDRAKVDLEQWAHDTEGMSIAHLAELIKSVFVFDMDYIDAIQTLREMNDFANLHSSKYEKGDKGIGFKAKVNNGKEFSGSYQEGSLEERLVAEGINENYITEAERAQLERLTKKYGKIN